MSRLKQRALIGWCPACRTQVRQRVVETERGPRIASFCGCTDAEEAAEEQKERTAPKGARCAHCGKPADECGMGEPMTLEELAGEAPKGGEGEHG